MSVASGALAGLLGLGLLLLDGRTAIGAAWPPGARFGLAAALVALLALWPKARPVAPAHGLLLPLPVLAAAAALDLANGAQAQALLRGAVLLALCVLACALARPGAAWWGALALLASLWTLAHAAQSLGQPGPGRALFGLAPWLASLPPAGLLEAALGGGRFERQLGAGLLLLALAAGSRWPRGLGAALALLGGLGLAAPVAAQTGPRAERLALVALELEGPLTGFELRLGGRLALSARLELEPGERRAVELPLLRPSALELEPEIRAAGPGRAALTAGPREPPSAPPAPALLGRPAPEPASAPPRRLPGSQAALLAAALLAGACAPRQGGAAGRGVRALLLAGLPLGLALGIAPGLARPPEAPVAATLELDGGPLALEQRAGRGRLALGAAAESLVAWPEWAPGWIEARFDPARARWTLAAVAPGALLVERRSVPAPSTAALEPGWRRWDRRADGGFDARGAPGPTAPPSWALWPTPPGRAAWWATSGRPGAPVWRWCAGG